MVGQARLTGRLDVLEIDKHSARTLDYKTGKAISNWNGQGKQDYEQVKMHHYRQQLLFYKLLVDGSRSWGDKGIRLDKAELVFVEPDKRGEIESLKLDFSDQSELERTRRLIQAVWSHVQRLDFPEVSEYQPTIRGIIDFEDSLLRNNN